MEIRYIADAEQWESWQQPSDKGNNRAQLRRIVEEWQAQQSLLSDLAEVHPDINRALATVLHSHELLSRATVTIQAAASTEAPTTEHQEPDFDFEESVAC